MSENYAEVVAEGIKLLDREGPSNWRSLIDVDTLRLESCDVCVLGQVFGGYDDGCERLDITAGQSKKYGFNTDYSMLDLTQAWKDALGKNDTLVEKGDVYHDNGGCCAAKVISTHIVDMDGSKVTVYVYLPGSIYDGKFKASAYDQPQVGLKSRFETGGSFYKKLTPPFVFKEGQFVTNASGEVYYVLNSAQARKVQDQGGLVSTATIDTNDLREVRTANGALFSDGVI